MFNGKTHYKWPFSIAMLVITRGYYGCQNLQLHGMRRGLNHVAKRMASGAMCLDYPRSEKRSVHIAGKLRRIAMLRLELRLLKSSIIIIIIFCISINDIIWHYHHYLSVGSPVDISIPHRLVSSAALALVSIKSQTPGCIGHWMGVLQTWELYNYIYIYVCVCIPSGNLT